MAIAGMARLRIGLALAAVVGCQTAASPAPAGIASATLGPTASAASPSSALGCIPTAASERLRPAWADRVWYEVFVRSFFDADGDGIGDLAGLTSKLDALNDGVPGSGDDLGIEGIWLMPVAEAASYHGYDVIDYTAVERDYGAAAAMRSLVEAAHERGIAVIVDLVVNHTSREHPWFQDALGGGPHRDWYIWSQGDPGWPPAAGVNPWHRTRAGDWYYGAFWEGMPDLDLRNPEVTAEIERIARVWLEDFGVDGFRIDAAKHLIENGPDAQTNTGESREWLQRFTAAVHATKPDAMVLGEVYDSTAASASYVPEVDTTFAFELAGRTLLGLQSHDATIVAGGVQEAIATYGGAPFSTFLTNHDQPRVMTQLSSMAAGRVAASLLLAGPGVPYVYYGEEIGLTGGKPDERIRSPLPWTAEAGAGFTTGTPWEPLEDGWEARNVEAQTVDQGSLRHHYQALVEARRLHPALGATELWQLETSDTAVYATLARSGADVVLIVANLDLRELADVRISLAAGPCGLGAPALVYTDGIDAAALALPEIAATGGLAAWEPAVALPPYSTIILSFGEVSP